MNCQLGLERISKARGRQCLCEAAVELPVPTFLLLNYELVLISDFKGTPHPWYEVQKGTDLVHERLVWIGQTHLGFSSSEIDSTAV